MKRIKYFLINVVAIAVLVSCSGEDTGLYKNITGTAGEMIVVISKESWEGSPGKLIRDNLAQPIEALPQDEPLFDLIDVPHVAFKNIFQSTRNIIRTSISTNVDKVGVSFKDDVWAYPQATVHINAKSPEQFVKIFNENKDKILAYFLSAEKERLSMNYKKYYEKTVYNILNKDFGVTMKVPPGFKIMEQKKDVLWFQYDTPEIFQGIVLYSHPYVSDSAFTVNYALPIRDSILRSNVPGPTKGSFMVTERRLDPMYNVLKHNGNYASDMRGLWRVENDFMGGPYISLSVLDAANQRVINAFGFVYAPSKDKRNFIRQVEAMIYSMKLNNQIENDKLNKQSDFEVDVKTQEAG